MHYFTCRRKMKVIGIYLIIVYSKFLLHVGWAMLLSYCIKHLATDREPRDGATDYESDNTLRKSDDLSASVTFTFGMGEKRFPPDG